MQKERSPKASSFATSMTLPLPSRNVAETIFSVSSSNRKNEEVNLSPMTRG